MQRLLLVATALVLLGAGTTEAWAQKERRGIREVHRHSGFWISGGLGGGWGDASDAFQNRSRGGAAYLRLGGTPHPRALVGVEIIGWSQGFGDRGNDPSRGNVTLTTLLYPSLAGGWFVKGGFGGTGFDDGFVEREGLGLTLGTGFDFRIGGNFYLTPNVDYLVQFFEDSTNGVLLFTLGATIH